MLRAKIDEKPKLSKGGFDNDESRKRLLTQDNTDVCLPSRINIVGLRQHSRRR